MMRNTNNQRSNVDETSVEDTTGRSRDLVPTAPAHSCLLPPPDPPYTRPRLPDDLRQYSSKLDQVRGPLRTTSDGKLVGEDTGDWLVLDTPPHDAENLLRNETKAPSISLPEAKNGATGLENSRARDPLGRILREGLSSRLRRTSANGTYTEVPAQSKVHADVEQVQEKREGGVDV
jgi:hypothetical protein